MLPQRAYALDGVAHIVLQSGVVRRLVRSVVVTALWACLAGCGSTSGDPPANAGGSTAGGGGAGAGGSSAGGAAGSAGAGAAGTDAGGAAGSTGGGTGGAAGGGAGGSAAGGGTGGSAGGGGTGGAAGGGGGAGGSAGGGSTSLLVYDANVENLETPNDTCPGDWKDLFAFMKVQGDLPDVFLVQQLSDQAELDVLLAHLKSTLGSSYAGVIAEANPAPFNSPCGQAKAKQTNAIVYRVDRLNPVGSPHVWKTFKRLDGACVRDGLSRTRSVMQRFFDKGANKHVTVASIHWSTNQEPGPDPACALANVKETAQKLSMSGFEADLFVFGGDTNEPDLDSTSPSSGYRAWYAAANADNGGTLGFRDAVYDLCAGKSNVKACLLDNWTIGGERRIDYIFSRRAAPPLPGVSSAHTVTFAEGNAADLKLTGTDSPADYSDHRAVRARVAY